MALSAQQRGISVGQIVRRKMQNHDIDAGFSSGRWAVSLKPLPDRQQTDKQDRRRDYYIAIPSCLTESKRLFDGLRQFLCRYLEVGYKNPGFFQTARRFSCVFRAVFEGFLTRPRSAWRSARRRDWINPAWFGLFPIACHGN